MIRWSLLLVFVAAGIPATRRARSQEVESSRLRVSSALGAGKYDEAEKLANALLDPDATSGAKLFVADTLLRCGSSARALKLFDEYVASTPRSEPYLWQRGIAHYFVGEFDAGAKQFEIHRTVNPNDVENAAWHFLCVAKKDSPEVAQQLLLPAPGDPRPPMAEVLEMFRTGDKAEVEKRIAGFPEGSRGRASAEFYGWFYLGLYEDALGNVEKARQWLDEVRRVRAAKLHGRRGQGLRAALGRKKRQSHRRRFGKIGRSRGRRGSDRNAYFATSVKTAFPHHRDLDLAGIQQFAFEGLGDFVADDGGLFVVGR